ncbi:MAG: hypothetical protein QXO70_03455, partial [Candidatus Pacearchaeota archaeon]
TPMPFKTRILGIAYSFFLLFVINISRILIFSFIFIFSEKLFTTLHFILWFFLSSVIVFAIWYSEIKLLDIKKIPIYSDIKFLLKIIKKDKNL